MRRDFNTQIMLGAGRGVAWPQVAATTGTGTAFEVAEEEEEGTMGRPGGALIVTTFASSSSCCGCCFHFLLIFYLFNLRALFAATCGKSVNVPAYVVVIPSNQMIKKGMLTLCKCFGRPQVYIFII